MYLLLRYIYVAIFFRKFLSLKLDVAVIGDKIRQQWSGAVVSNHFLFTVPPVLSKLNLAAPLAHLLDQGILTTCGSSSTSFPGWESLV